MDECKGEPLTTAAAAAAAADRQNDSEMSDADHSSSAAAPSTAAAVFMSRLLPARAEVAECDICNEPLESREAAGAAAAASRLPRMLPCGHSWCTSCIQKGLDANGGLLKCPQCGDLDPPQRPDSALKLPKNFTAIKMIESQADRDAMAELAALPCQHCDPSQPRRTAKVHCKDCSADYCKEHDQQVHCVGALLGHQRVSIAAHAAQMAAACAAKKAAALAAVAAASRLAAKTEEQKIDKAVEDAKKGQEQLPRELDSMEDVVESTAKQLNAAADRLRSDFQQHRQSVTRATQQLTDHAAALEPLRQSAQQVQQAGDFDANLQFAQLQRDSQRVHAQLQQASAAARHSFGLNGLLEIQVSVPLSLVTRQSQILSADETAKLAPMCKGLDFKAHPELLYRGSRDGFRKEDFVRCCANKGSTLTLVKVAGNNFVFGAYTHCSWPAVNGTVADPIGKSFLFSLVNASGKAVRFSLRDKDRAIRLSEWISFGACKEEDDNMTGWPNFVLMYEGAADQKDANAANHPRNDNTPYEVDGDAVCDSSFLAGQTDFAAAEIEVFQL